MGKTLCPIPRGMQLQCSNLCGTGGQKDTQMNEIAENPEVALHKYGQTMFCRRTKAIQWRNGSLSNKCCWSNWRLISKK